MNTNLLLAKPVRLILASQGLGCNAALFPEENLAPCIADCNLHTDKDQALANALLLRDAWNSCVLINPKNPRNAARLYPLAIAVLQKIAAEAWRYDEEIKHNEPVFHLSRSTLDAVNQVITQATGRDA